MQGLTWCLLASVSEKYPHLQLQLPPGLLIVVAL